MKSQNEWMPSIVFKAIVKKTKDVVFVTEMDYIRNLVLTVKAVRNEENILFEFDFIHAAYSFDELIFVDYLGFKDKKNNEVFNHDIVVYKEKGYEIMRKGMGIILVDQHFTEEINIEKIDLSEIRTIGNTYNIPEFMGRVPNYDD